ncbi:hypothetical protein ACKI1I_10815 [Streptomyces turgidiscabies]|uniref:Putative membrane protein n=1 Tax=Streptomyces turgidiscabies (strain Car8) TaxID=698760 RepID=L7EX79_STRT8|nr:MULTISPECIES: hypothetical protein [Streptomyces]ELP63627.1 putative membrane protein [Streptomyces turgidiscabies Car8]MDX3499949.1 hypothetical protein [Streptomyces turgidiscabies]GAQ76988.1 hypothetical protein T45_08800 [Streptomyces turgidiscabies]
MNPASTPDSPDSGGTAEPQHVITADERAEYERMRRHASMRHRRLRRAGSSVLLLLALLLAPVAVVAAWVQDTVSDTDRYVKTVAPLASDPAVQEVVINRLTDRVVKNVDVAAVTDALATSLRKAGAAPRIVAGAESLEGPLRNAVRTVVDRTVTRVITGDAFQQVWEGANRRSHAAVVDMLTGDGKGAVRAEGDAVRLNVGEVVDQVRERLVAAGFDKASAIPDTDRTVTLFQTKELGKAQDAMRLLDVLGTWLPVLTVVLAALAVWTAPARRVMLMITAAGVGVMMVVLLVALAVVRRVYLDSVPPAALPTDAAAAIYDTFLRFLRDSTRTLLVVAVITVLIAYLYGPGRPARAVRATAVRGTTATGQALSRAGVPTGSTGRWLTAHRAWTTGGVIAAGALALVLWNHPTVPVVTLILVIAVAVLLILAIVAAAAGPDDRAAGRAGP